MPATPTVPVAPRASTRRWQNATAIVAVFLSAAALLGVSPFVLEGPGPVVNTVGKLDDKAVMSVSGAKTYPTESVLDLTTVSAEGQPGHPVAASSVIGAWVDPTIDIVPREYMYPAGTTSQQQSEHAAIEMTSSQQLSVLAALNELKIPYGVSTEVADLATQVNASVLKPKDVITSIEGTPVTSTASLQEAVQASTATTVTLGILRDGKPAQVKATLAPSAEGKPSLGVYITPKYTLPFEVTFAIENIGGPSAGTMLALGLIDQLTPGSLAGQRHVAGTGTITEDGKIGAIGGIAQKVVGARNEGATVFLAPQANCAELAGRVPEGLTVYAASTLGEARTVLTSLANESDMASFQRCG